MRAPLKKLRDEQAAAADPASNAWTSASAGTGKTQVLTARVLRLLLSGAAPERILSLTFTKAGAAEMQSRIFDQLAAWVVASDAHLDHDLAAIRAPIGPEMRERARQLFARTLDARGGLRVQTLHSFAQSLLASFPVEAGIAPGFAALDERSTVTLHARVLAEQIEAASDEGDTGFIDDIGQMSIASGESRLAQIAAILIGYGEAIAALGAPAGFGAKMRRALGVPADGSADDVLGAALAALDDDGLRRLGRALASAGGVEAPKAGDALLCWLGFAPDARVEHLDLLVGVFLTATGSPRKRLLPKSLATAAFETLVEAQTAAIQHICDLRARLATAALAARHLRVGARLAAAYAAHKARAGVIDYDDMIARAAALLSTDGMGAWVQYKLDQRIDHLLVDEAQDTNAAQWDIIGALTNEFFDGLGARDIVRTLFVVGDFKQAIMSFQGSDPGVFRDRRDHFRERVESALLPWGDVPLSESFRSVPTVLEVVDATLDELGHARLGMHEPVPPHGVARKDMPGAVTIWPPLASLPGDDAVKDEAAWVPDNQIRMAHKLADQIAAWLDPAAPLMLPARGRAVRPEDILVLVRSRGEFMGPLVAALHDKGVAVAGVDRLQLTRPLAVQDLLAVARFALQPNDDLTLATLLTSPLLGWSQDQLRALAQGRGRVSLWSRLRNADGAPAQAARDWLGEVLRIADFSAPYEFFETLLSGPLQARRRLLARLGEEARDAIGAVLGQALAFELANAPSLQGFLAWIEADDVDLKRDPEAAISAVRIMTVHGAKGLQAPVVVLADATHDLKRDTRGYIPMQLDGGAAVPIFYGGASGRIGEIAKFADAEAIDAEQEHWRLMYVAMTRAEDMLFVGGALPKPRGKDPAVVPENSWYGAIDRAMSANWDPPAEDDAIWDKVRTHRGGAGAPVADGRDARVARTGPNLPDWARAPAPVEARPPRPLSPSAIAADDVVSAPPGPAALAASRRGSLMHSLFERLPAVAPARRAAVADRWLAANAPALPQTARNEIAAAAITVITEPQFAAAFGPDALAEAPIAAIVGELVIAGKVDRLVVTKGHIQLIDFKTGARVPADAEAVEPYYLRQMAAYVAALRVIFPGHEIEAALLYTHAAKLIVLPDAMLRGALPATAQI
jgi:ATP-dependent helicase/nuclease subunit A